MTVRDLESILAGHPFFAGLDDAAIALIAGCARNVHFAAGEVVFRAGEPADWFYLIRAGRVTVDLDIPPRGPLRILTIESGEILGWSWLFEPYRWTVTATAQAATRALAMDGLCLRGKCDDDPALGYELMKRFAAVMVKRLQEARLQLGDVYGHGGGGG